MSQAYIVAAARTAGGRKGGKLKGWHPADLGGAVIDALVERAGTDPALIEDVIFGCVTQVGEQALNVARGAVLASRLPGACPPPAWTASAAPPSRPCISPPRP